jgi:hypothetical protein
VLPEEVVSASVVEVEGVEVVGDRPGLERKELTRVPPIMWYICVLYVICHMSCVMCHMSCVICYMSYVICHI